MFNQFTNCILQYFVNCYAIEGCDVIRNVMSIENNDDVNAVCDVN